MKREDKEQVENAGWGVKRLCLLAIRLYQLTLGPFTAGACRFYPSCSEYACEALKKYPLLRALRLSFWRCLKCGPWNGGGYDPP